MHLKKLDRYYRLCQRRQTRAVKRLRHGLYQDIMLDLRLYLRSLSWFALSAGTHELLDELQRTIDQLERKQQAAARL